jgi:hypothetical protein
VGTFLSVQGKETTGINLFGNDLRRAKKPFLLADELNEGVIQFR